MPADTDHWMQTMCKWMSGFKIRAHGRFMCASMISRPRRAQHDREHAIPQGPPLAARMHSRSAFTDMRKKD